MTTTSSQDITQDKSYRTKTLLNVLLLFFALLLAGGIGWLLSSNRHIFMFASAKTGGTGERKILFYQSPMHPWIKSDKPGKCTICGMALAPIYEGDKAFDENSDFVKLSDTTVAIIGVETTPARIAPLKHLLYVSGAISDDETKHHIIPAQVNGRIEKLYVNQVGVDVTNGQDLAEIYSPELLTAQHRYIDNLNTYSEGNKENNNVITRSELLTNRETLLSLGMREADIKKLEKTKETNPIIIIRSFADGTVISQSAYEGQYIKVNDPIFEIGDFRSLWFIFDVYETSLALIKLNQQVTVSLPSLPDETFKASISFIDPTLRFTRTARVRVDLHNPQRRILNRQTAYGTVHIETEPRLIIPRSAVLYTTRKFPVAYVDLGEGAYQLRQIVIGKTGDKDVEIISGIKEGEKVVTQAALLIDSQSQLAHINDMPDMSDHENPENKSIHNEIEHNAKSQELNVQPVILSDKLVQIMLSATSALAADNLAEYQKQLPPLIEEINQTTEEIRKTLTPLAEKLVKGKDLKEARRPFEPFSNSFANIIKLQPVEKRQAKIFQCPMSPVLGTAKWIQNQNNEILNPFFGSEMLNCGVEVK
ncbi:MAG: efflux RND transporter periplasmic adaptor subunit [Planctomycetaceae bacterium]|jgi:Cu(I)/Ag(I) efflux system membrane fusion protein|nr:efflux RND transporter periplasmic adaptor subunit [Planctomycetaceae bacterium]